MQFFYEKSEYVIMLLLQITSSRFPVVVKMGHAHSGMGKVVQGCTSVLSVQCEHSISGTLYFGLCFPRLKWTINMIFKILPVLWH